MHVCAVCVCTCICMYTTWMSCPQRPENGTRWPRNWIYNLTWVLGTEPGHLQEQQCSLSSSSFLKHSFMQLHYRNEHCLVCVFLFQHLPSGASFLYMNGPINEHSQVAPKTGRMHKTGNVIPWVVLLRKVCSDNISLGSLFLLLESLHCGKQSRGPSPCLHPELQTLWCSLSGKRDIASAKLRSSSRGRSQEALCKSHQREEQEHPVGNVMREVPWDFQSWRGGGMSQGMQRSSGRCKETVFCQFLQMSWF